MDKGCQCGQEKNNKVPQMRFCANQNCSKISHFCHNCLHQLHQDHRDDCLRLNQLQFLIRQYIQTQTEVISNSKDLQNYIKSSFDRYVGKLESDFKILTEMDKQLKDHSYSCYQTNNQLIKEYYSKNQQNKISCLITEIQQILEAFQVIIEEKEELQKQFTLIEVQQERLKHHESEQIKKQSIKNKAWEYYKKGQELYEKGQYKEASEQFNQSLKNENILSDKGVYLKGMTLLYLDRYQDAIICFDQIIQINPNVSDVFINKGNALQNLTHYQDAIVCYDQAIKIDPNDCLAFYNKGNTLFDLNRYQDAIACYDQAIKISVMHSIRKVNECRALQNLNQYQNAVDEYDQALLRKMKPIYMKHKADALFSLGNQQESRLWYQNALNAGYDKETIKNILKIF